jgi:Zn-finger nucleic acid-binding protein
MNCPNCGAPMDLFDRRRYFFCRYCGRFEFLDAAEADGVQVLETSAGAPCPVCATPLSSALLDGEHRVQRCESCRGMLMSRGSFGDVVNRRRAWAAGPPTTPSPLDARELDRHLICPGCGERMQVHPYFGPGAVVIDSCDRCDAIWIDFGELKQIEDAPGRDRGSHGRR